MGTSVLFSMLGVLGLIWSSLAAAGVPLTASNGLRPTAELTKNSAVISVPSPHGPSHVATVQFSGLSAEPSYCVSPGSMACIAWADSAGLQLSPAGSPQDGSLLAMKVTSTTGAIQTCFDIEGQHLYGGSIKNVYPQEKSDLQDVPYITADITRYHLGQAVAERYWYTSSGFNVKIDPEVPLFVSQNKTTLCFIANNSFPYDAEPPVTLSYTFCHSEGNLRTAVGCFFQSYDKPVPPELVIAAPIWSTWVEYKKDIDQLKAHQFFNDIKSHDFKLSVMEIDDAWETCYGSQVFDTKKFPDAKAMVDIFHAEGYLATLWVHPFVGPGCPSIQEYEPYLVKYPNGSVGITEWWDGKGASLINFNDPKAAEWYVNRLKGIQSKYGFDSFKFDAGEAAYLPGLSIDEQALRIKRPNLFTYNYIKAASNFGTLAEARVGAEANEFKLMQRLQDTNSVWDAENWGLRSVIKSVLQLSLHGYGAILPDMIGGNCYGQNPSKELFIRWTQLNAFLPVMQFSLVPWKYDAETVGLTQKFVDLHYKYKDRILAEFRNTSHPVINPIWWISPEDPIAQDIDDQFLLGDSLLVAPVVREGAVSRDIYLPAGRWKDANTDELHTGPAWLRGYSAPLSVLPYFLAVSP